jgi:hypothetical protein
LAFLNPVRDLLLVGSSVTAQARSLPYQRLVKLALAEALQDARDMGPGGRPGPAASSRRSPTAAACSSSFSSRPLGVTFRRAVDLRDEDPSRSPAERLSAIARG